MKMGYKGGKLASGAIQEEIQHLQPPAGCTQAFYEVWEQIVGDFPPEHFRESDRGVLEAHVGFVTRLREVERILVQQPLMIEGRNGLIQNPLIDMADKLGRTILAQARALRIVPSSRMVNTQLPKQSEHRRREAEVATAGKRPSGIRLAS